MRPPGPNAPRERSPTPTCDSCTRNGRGRRSPWGREEFEEWWRRGAPGRRIQVPGAPAPQPPTHSLPVVPVRPGPWGTLQRRVWSSSRPRSSLRVPSSPSSSCLPGRVPSGHSPVDAYELIALAPLSSVLASAARPCLGPPSLPLAARALRRGSSLSPAQTGSPGRVGHRESFSRTNGGSFRGLGGAGTAKVCRVHL